MGYLYSSRLAVRRDKKSPGQETGSGIKGVTHVHLGPIWYHSEPSDVPYSPIQFLVLDFFVTSYSKIALVVAMEALCSM